jgi:hypothetical protein
MHPFLSAFLSLCLGDLATRLLFSPTDPFYIPAAKKTGGRLLVQMPIVIAILVAVTPLGPVDLRMALVVIAYLGVYLVNQIFWQSMSTGHARFRWTHLTLIGVTLCAADLLARVPFPAIPLIQVGDTAKWHLLVGTTVYHFTIFADPGSAAKCGPLHRLAGEISGRNRHLRTGTRSGRVDSYCESAGSVPGIQGTAVRRILSHWHLAEFGASHCRWSYHREDALWNLQPQISLCADCLDCSDVEGQTRVKSKDETLSLLCGVIGTSRRCFCSCATTIPGAICCRWAN